MINETINRKQLQVKNISCSKYPPAFEIDLHIDDSKGVAIEAARHNFTVIQVSKEDSYWTQTILKTLKSL